MVPDAAQLGAVVVAIDDVVQDLQHQLPQLAVFHQGNGEERIQEGGGQRSRHGLGLEARGHLRRDSGGREGGCVSRITTVVMRLICREAR